MNKTHRYNRYIHEEDPRASQPEGILTMLKPHQLASLHKAILIERYGKVFYHVPPTQETLNLRRILHHGDFSVQTNTAILGDMIGYGKTLTALSIIASTPTKDIHQNREKVCAHYSTRTSSYIQIQSETDPRVRPLFKSTLVVVPHGPVYQQWFNSLSQYTKLRYLALDDLRVIRKKCPPENANYGELQAFFDSFDVILVKNTGLPKLLTYYTSCVIYGFSRIMVDEAHDILGKLPMMEYDFLWLITATFQEIYRASSIQHMGVVVRELFTEERINNVLVKCDNTFTQKSFLVPPYQEITYRCQMPRMMHIIQPFLTDQVMELVNANDIEGAIRELGGTTETEDNILQIVSNNLQRDIYNKEREKEYVKQLDMPEDAKASRIRHIVRDLEKLQQQMDDLKERVRSMTEDVCTICYSDMESPVLLACTHVFCGQCIMKWFEVNEAMHKACPTCREPIRRKEELTVIVKQKNPPKEGSAKPKKKATQEMSKIQTILHILQDRLQGKFIIFSQFDFTFYNLMDEFKRLGITHSELKGTTHHMSRTLERFRNGEIQVILLNTAHAGSGIDICCATDVILFHRMNGMEDQAIGRAHRVGRTEPVTVHRLCYPHEMVA